MQFASPLPWWAAVLVALAIAGVAYLSYRRPLVPLDARQRGALIAFRALSLTLVVLFLCRPVMLLTPEPGGSSVVAILIDASRSMRVNDANGQSRLASAVEIVSEELLPSLTGQFTTELFTIGAANEPLTTVTAAALPSLPADGQHSPLSGAVAAARAQLRGRALAGVVLVSDGAETAASGVVEGAPVFAIGVGSPESPRDREVIAIAAGDPRLDNSSVDLRVSTVSHRFGRAGFELRLLANGQQIDARTLTPAADGSPVDALFTVSPDPVAPTVYTAEIVAAADESIRENNTRSVLIEPPGRKRRVLMLTGAPGYDSSFAMRALAADPQLEVDSVVRKGRNDQGEETFLVQAASGRAAALISGLPATRAALFTYDALVIANLEGEFFTRAQLQLVADFVSERGGGLLVFGGQSFATRGYVGTPLEPALPVELSDRRGGLLRTALSADRSAAPHTVTATRDGERHQVMRIAASPDDSAKLWAELPALAAAATLGGPRPGAAVLAVTTVPSGGIYPLIAVQRYGAGRSMIFTGEASWRWRMMRPSTDRAHEHFWRQAARWLAASSPDAVTVTVPGTAEPGDALQVDVTVRDASFAPAAGAVVTATLAAPDGEIRALTTRREAGGGRFTAAIRPEREGLHRVQVEARQGASLLGAADRWFHVGTAEREFADPRLNEGVLQRMATATGGRYVRAADARQVAGWLENAAPAALAPQRRELWHEPWAFALVIALLASEWLLRRRWGLR